MIAQRKKGWTAKEDQIVKFLKEEEQIHKWSFIAKKMAEEYGMKGRTGKQCRQRYHNHLDSTILRTEWTYDEQKYLYALHDEIGNKWAIIAQKLPGRTDNCVKNHFYSKMRKALRKLNKVIHQYLKRDMKEIKMTVLYKIIQATDQKFQSNPNVDEDVSENCQLKNNLLQYSNDDDNPFENNLEKLQQLAIAIHQFSSKYRRKTKKNRRNSMQPADLLSIPKFEQKIKFSSDKQSSYEEDEDHSFYLSHEDYERENPSEIQNKLQKQQFPDVQEVVVNEDQNQVNIPTIRINQTRRHTFSDPNQVKIFLQTQGVLFDDKSRQQFIYPPPILSSKGSSKSQESLEVEQKCSLNMLSESIEKMRLSELNFQMDVEQLDQDNKLFISN